jgi:hypothetical protein
MVLTLLLPLVSCDLFDPQWIGFNEGVKVYIEGVSGFNNLDFEISQSYRIVVELNDDVEVNDETYKDIQIDYNEDNAVVYYSNYSKRNNQIFFYIYLYELGQGDELSVSYNGQTTGVNYKVVDYDFKGHRYVSIDSIDALDQFPEFKDMLLSVEKYEFTEPYVGTNIYNVDTRINGYGEQVKYWSYYVDRNEENSEYISTDYLKYLKDSVYYPAKFSSVPDNPISYVDVTMEMPMSASFDEGSGRETMSNFYVSYSVIDPCCTGPKNPIRSMSFRATSRKNAMTYSRSDKTNGSYPSQLSIFFDKYPEQFFVYDLNGITVYILCTDGNGVNAYFDDGRYFYSLSAGYDK